MYHPPMQLFQVDVVTVHHTRQQGIFFRMLPRFIW